MTISAQEYRDVLRHFPGGVTLVTTRVGERIHGMTVSAFASVSAEPPRVLVVIDRNHTMFALLRRDDAVFAVNFLAEEQQELSQHFATAPEDRRFDSGNWSQATTGAPVLADGLAWLDCRVIEALESGSHTIFIGAVVASRVNQPDQAPLVYWNRAYRKVEKS
jgi:flavin reductase (DIM6/NTAB) family NADH-FMN oxidoreductase RutF